MNNKIKSPCNGVCKLKGNLCISCNRTIEEIVNWTNMSHEKRTEVMEKIKNKR